MYFKTTNDSYHLLFSWSFSLIMEESLKERIFRGEKKQNINLNSWNPFMFTYVSAEFKKKKIN